MLAGGETVHDASLSAAAFVHERPVSLIEMCSNSAQVYMAVSSLMYTPSVMKQVRNSFIGSLDKTDLICVSGV